MWFETCAGGKRRVQGVCPPYDWCIPKLAGSAFTQRGLLTSPNWVDGLDAVHNAVYPTLDPGIKPFLLPALRRQVFCLRIVLCHECSHVPSRLGRAFPSVQLGAGQDADQFTRNSVRRFMPTAAGLLPLDPEQAQALGYWQDVPKPSAEIGNSPLNAARATFSMSRRERGVKVFVTALIQLVSLAGLSEMMRRALQDAPANFQKFWKHPSLT